MLQRRCGQPDSDTVPDALRGPPPFRVLDRVGLACHRSGHFRVVYRSGRHHPDRIQRQLRESPIPRTAASRHPASSGRHHWSRDLKTRPVLMAAGLSGRSDQIPSSVLHRSSGALARTARRAPRCAQQAGGQPLEDLPVLQHQRTALGCAGREEGCGAGPLPAGLGMTAGRHAPATRPVSQQRRADSLPAWPRPRPQSTVNGSESLCYAYDPVAVSYFTHLSLHLMSEPCYLLNSGPSARVAPESLHDRNCASEPPRARRIWDCCHITPQPLPEMPPLCSVPHLTTWQP